MCFFELYFVLFELSFEAEVGTDDGSAFAYVGDGFFEGPKVCFHEVGKDEGAALDRGGVTREMPAAQCTRMLPLVI